VEHRISHTRDEVWGDLRAVELLQVRLDVAYAHAAGVERENLLVEARETTLMLGDKLGLKRAQPVAGDSDLDGPTVGLHGLRRVAVARVAGTTASDGILLEAEVLGQLRVQHALHQRSLQALEQASRSEQVLRTPYGLHELLDELGLQRYGSRIVHGC